MANVAERVKKALSEVGWTQKKLCNELEVTETGLRRMMDNNTWKLETIEKMAVALKKPVTFFIGEELQKDDLSMKIDSPDQLHDIIDRLEKSFVTLSEQFANQLSVKDQQIAGLQRTVDALVGKSEGADLNQLFIPTGDFGKDIRTYALAAMSGVQLGSPARITP